MIYQERGRLHLLRNQKAETVPEYKAQNHARSVCPYRLDISLLDLSQTV